MITGIRQTKHHRPDSYKRLALGVLLLCITGAVPAQSSDGWQWRASIYGWLPDIGGTSRFPSGGSGPEIEVDASTLVKNLNFTTMAALDASKGQWGFFTDFIYMDVGNSRNIGNQFNLGEQQIPGDIEATVRFDLKSMVWTFAGTFNLTPDSSSENKLLFGVQMLDIDQKLGWNIAGEIDSLPLPGRSGQAAVSSTNWDAVVGIKGRGPIGEGNWKYLYHADLGSGDSDLTYQLMGGFAYAFDWGVTSLAWRYLDYNLDKNAGIEGMDFNGPQLGVSFNW